MSEVGLGKAIRFLREEAKMTQEVLMEKSGISASELLELEDGQADPTWGSMRELAAALHVSMESLAELAEDFEETDIR
jgi:transcriptional regulator with XRE-family HTH domain